MSIFRYFIELSYNGTHYHGWQRQPNAITVQQVIEESIEILLQKKTKVTGAGRTDTGVHARQYIAHFDWEENIISKKKDILNSLNGILPKDIVIHNLYLVDTNNHARYDAISRTYCYYISLIKEPFDLNCYYLYGNMDVKKMNEASEILSDIQDFASFGKLHSNYKTTFCKVYKAGWEQQNNRLVFSITADRFLRDMVRSIVGTMIQIGFGKISIRDFKKIIESKNRSQAGMSVPAKALFLEKIEYPYDFRK